MMNKKNNKYALLSLAIIVILMSMRFERLGSENGSDNDMDVNRVEVRDPNFLKAFVTDVVDGDTAWVEVEGERKKVRFIGVNTPESGEPNYKEATEFTKAGILNQWIYLEKDISDTDIYGRLLRYIWLDIPRSNTDDERREKLFNSKLIEAGFAEVVVYEPDIKYVDYFRSINEQ